MNKPLNKILFTMILFIVVVFAIIAAGMVVLYYFGEKLPDPKLIKSLRDEYSVHIDVKIINSSGGDVIYIVPGRVRWNSEHNRLLYNLSNPKEATLAIVEALSNQDVQALDILTAQSSKNYYERNGYNTTQMLEAYLSNYKDTDKPYIFGFAEGEDDTSEDMIGVELKRIDGYMRFDLEKQPDGTWKM